MSREIRKLKEMHTTPMNDTTLQQNYPVMKQTYAEEGRETKDLPEDKTPY